MKLELSAELKNFTGVVIKDQDEKVITLGSAISNILLMADRREQNIDAFKAYLLAQKFYDVEEVDIDKSDFDFVKRVVKGDKNYSTILLGQIIELLDLVTEKEKEEKKKEKETK